MNLVYGTTVASLLVQVLVAGFTAVGFFVDTAESVKEDLNTILTLELVSQLIEFLWYVSIVLVFKDILTWTRYIDWVISTPFMLVSTSLFFQHRKNEELWNVLDTFTFYAMLTFNWCMLGFGYLFERYRRDKVNLLFLGSVSLVGSFVCLASFVPDNDIMSISLFWTIYVVWSLYGVAVLFEYETKNIAYNLLDIVSKNFYGFFLTVYMLTR